MSYGIEITNDGGHVLIDGEHRNFRLGGYGVGVADQPFLYEASGVQPLVFMRPFVDNVWMGFIGIGYSQGSVGYASSGAPQFAYAAYQPYTVGEAFNSGYGMAVFNGNGVPVYSSNERALTISSVTHVPGIQAGSPVAIPIPNQNTGLLVNPIKITSVAFVPRGDGSYLYYTYGFQFMKSGLFYYVSGLTTNGLFASSDDRNVAFSIAAAEMP